MDFGSCVPDRTTTALLCLTVMELQWAGGSWFMHAGQGRHLAEAAAGVGGGGGGGGGPAAAVRGHGPALAARVPLGPLHLLARLLKLPTPPGVILTHETEGQSLSFWTIGMLYSLSDKPHVFCSINFAPLAIASASSNCLPTLTVQNNSSKSMEGESRPERNLQPLCERSSIPFSIFSRLPAGVMARLVRHLSHRELLPIRPPENMYVVPVWPFGACEGNARRARLILGHPSARTYARGHARRFFVVHASQSDVNDCRSITDDGFVCINSTRCCGHYMNAEA